MDDADNFNHQSFLNRLGKQISKVRMSKAYSQDRVCLEAGFARGTLSKIESGKVEAKITTLARIALTLGVPLRRLTDIEP